MPSPLWELLVPPRREHMRSPSSGCSPAAPRTRRTDAAITKNEEWKHVGIFWSGIGRWLGLRLWPRWRIEDVNLTGVGQKRKDYLYSRLTIRPCSGLEFSCAASLTFVRWISAGEDVPLPRPRLQLVHGTVPQKCARNALPARSGVLYRPAIEGLRCHPLLTSSMRVPEVTPN